ncbi:MAG: thiamine ABC transporter substrate binding subunit [Gammaproteobacteria bacterium]|nr:thiamine ABC transporter substrate binding subunit [Gammaproteobacteria bacterium]
MALPDYNRQKITLADGVTVKKQIALLTFSSLLSTVVTANTLNVYTYGSFASDWGPGPKIEKTFEAQCKCDLKFVTLDDGVSILNRLRLEGENSQADIILGLDDSLITTAKKTGLLAEHQVDLSVLTLPTKWQDNVFVPFDYGYFAFIYNNEKLKNPPTSLKELVEQRDDLTIIYQDPRTSTPGLGLMLWMKSVYGEQSGKAWQQLAKKTVTVTKGWSEAYNMFLKQEADMVLSYTTSPAYHMIAEGKNNYQAAKFSEGHYMQVEVAAMVKSSKNKALARQFMDFIVSDGFQREIATGNWMYPVINTKLPSEFNQLVQPVQSLAFDSDKVANQRKKWTREWSGALAF